MDRFPLAGEAESLRSLFVLVAGEIYPAFQLVQSRTTLAGYRTSALESFYDAQSTLAAIRSHPDPAMRGGPMALWSGRTLAQRLEDFFEAPAASRLRTTLRARKVAVAVLIPDVVRGSRLINDPALGHFSFFKVCWGDAIFKRLADFLTRNR
ncbi:hypothetical protein [Caballeronia glebae]|uniref:hypothetical protein n=1 Tax=Caballeronia glebae TaxID=1777143 RepID=UPI0038B7E017